MAGLFDVIGDAFFGDAPRVNYSGAFPGLSQLGGDFQQFLLERLTTPTEESKAFERGSQAIRDALSRSSQTARQRLGDRASARGFLDSGAVGSALGDIDRAEAEAFASQLQNLFLQLEDRRDRGVLPYLAAGSQEHLGIEGLRLESELARDNLQFDILSQFLGPAGSNLFGGTGIFAPADFVAETPQQDG